MTTFWVKVIPPLKRARIHKADCRHCRNGLGQENQQKGDGPTYWKGSFAAFEDAQSFMAALNYEDTGPCAYCKPTVV